MKYSEHGHYKPKRPPGEEDWTEAQWRAIKQDGHNILVTAGAGAGKTRVLVKRLLERISNPEAPLEVDKLLVVTFTNAAAAEMRKRLAAALEEKIRENPNATWLRRQLLLLNKAQISTVHSFCLEIIREYHHLIGLDPSFRMLDEGEALLLQQELLGDLLEEYYGVQGLNSPFYRLVESYSGVSGGDLPLQDLILRLYHFSLSHPEPWEWLHEKATAFEPLPKNGERLSAWLEIMQEDCRWELRKMLRRLQLALETSERPGGPTPYRENLLREIALLERALQASFASLPDLYEAVMEISFAKLKPCRGDVYEESIRKRTTALRNRCKKDLASLKEQIFSRSLEDQEAELSRLAPLIKILVDLVQDFHRRYLTLKGERGVADFNDLEHFALQILREQKSPPGENLPSVAAQSYQKRFACVLVDEYQDINQLQESIINLVSRNKPGNIFMVGDVKQSIYRFRLAEPELFLQKMRGYKNGMLPGEAIHLSHNFRSRREVIDAVNYLFRQIMDEPVGEVAYDNDARLRCGALYPENISSDNTHENKYNNYVAEMQFISLNEITEQNCNGEDAVARGERDADVGENENNENKEVNEGEDATVGGMEAEEEWELAALEGKLIARRIREIRGEGEERALYLYNKKTGTYGPPAYRDMVILLRSYKNCAPVILEELQRFGIPAYAELATGYFAATEVEVIISLLKIIDNPYQDIPFVAVLRSPLVGMRGEELAQVRTAAPNAPFYEAAKAFVSAAGKTVESDLTKRNIYSFLEQLYRWQEKAQQESLGSLIWQLYSESGYYDMLGGMAGGRQRQANLRALYDRARQYESTSFRGLSRFLHFVERLRERGVDLGAARALGEQEDVVRILTVHKSKGLEFPVVFVAGLSRKFNMQELGRNFLLHKELGFGPKFIDPKLRITYPTLPWYALQKRLRLELLAEEMRILYVALTRAEQKLILVAAVKDLEKSLSQWAEQAREADGLLPVFDRAAARSFMHWLGPVMLSHPGYFLQEQNRKQDQIQAISSEQSVWQVKVSSAVSLCAAETAYKEAAAASSLKELSELERLKPVPVSLQWYEEIARRLQWHYPYIDATSKFAKLSVSALQRLQNAGFQGVDGDKPRWSEANHLELFKRPRFLTGTKPGMAEQGTAYHVVMQCLNLKHGLDELSIAEQIEDMVKREQLAPQERDMVDLRLIVSFFQNPLGQRLLKARQLWRELPFTLTLPAMQLFPEWQGGEEKVLIQGVIDCLFQEDDGLVLIDYKLSSKDTLREPPQELYRLQLTYYSRAIEQIRKERVKETYLYLINREEIVKVNI